MNYMYSQMDGETYQAHWRSAQNDAIPYSDDFPEVVILMVELLNGGKFPSEVSISLALEAEKSILTYRDNGQGCSYNEAQDRLFRWASHQSVNGKSIYGHGTKKFLAKCNDYDKIQFVIRSRVAGERKINEWVGPYLGHRTAHDITEIPNFPKHGFELYVEIPNDRFRHLKTAQSIFFALKELICSRKKQATLDTVKFSLHVSDGETVFSENSKENAWKSLYTVLLTSDSCKKLLDVKSELYPGVTMQLVSFTTGLLDTIPGFPTYGKMGGGVSTRVHCFNEDTMIEAHSWWKLRGIAVDPHNWHRIDFVFFEPVNPANKEHVDALPQPATTKVAYRYESKEWEAFKTLFNKIYSDNATQLRLPSKKELKASTKPAPSPSPPNEPSGPSVQPAIPQHFDDALMNEYFKQLVQKGKNPARYILPKWYSMGDVICYIENGIHNLVNYRKRQRGELDEDLEKAYVALAHYTNEKKLQKHQVLMTFFVNLTGKKAEERVASFKDLQRKLSPTVYPLADRIDFRSIN